MDQRTRKAHQNRVTGRTAAFRYSSNTGYCALPITGDTYRNCAHACVYCYEKQTPGQQLRSTFRVQARDHKDMFQSLYDNPEIREFIVHKRVALRIGVLSDPFPPMERWFRNTYRLTRMLAAGGFQVQFSTKNPGGIDAQHIEAMHMCSKAGVRVSFSTVDDAMAAKIEPGSPRPSERLEAMRKLADQGIDVGVRLAPFIHTFPGSSAQSTYDTFASAGVNNLSVELFRFSVTWRHTFDPAFWEAVSGETRPDADTDWRIEIKNKKSRMRKWAEIKEREFFSSVQDLTTHKYCSGGYNFVYSDPYILRDILIQVRDRCHEAGIRFGVCSFGDGMHNIDLMDGKPGMCACMPSDDWEYDKGALVPAWQKNQWADYLIPRVLDYGANVGLWRFICANDATVRPLVLEDEYPSNIVKVSEAIPSEIPLEQWRAAKSTHRSYRPEHAGVGQ